MEELLTKDQGILENVKGYQIPFLSQSLQQQLLRESHLNLKEKSVVAEEIGNLLKKIAIEKLHMKKVSAKSQFVTNLFLVKIWATGLFINLESNPVHPTPTFQNGELAITEGYPQADQLYVQIGSKRCIFLHPTCGGVEEICEILLGGGPIWNSVSMLWNCSLQFLRFHQIIEDSNCLYSENRHFDYNLSGRYAFNWQNS